MRRGEDIAVRFPGLYLVHHNLPGKELHKHEHPEHLLFLPLQGEMHVETERHRLTAAPGRMIYLPTRTIHSFQSSAKAGERLIALIDAKAWKAAEGGAFEAGCVAASQLCKEILFYLLLHPETRNARSLLSTLIQTVTESLEASCHLLELKHFESRVKDERVRKVLDYFEANYDGSFAMERAAKAAGLSVRSLNRLFATELSLTPKQVLTQVRVTHARELLLAGKPVTEAAFSVGYGSLAQFISVFRQLTGQLPSEVARLGQKS
jgi:AraC-like DNA-binding protein/mannose-6-phosphate isomerase-like protein (cupin superfamily)